MTNTNAKVYSYSAEIRKDNRIRQELKKVAVLLEKIRSNADLKQCQIFDNYNFNFDFCKEFYFIQKKSKQLIWFVKSDSFDVKGYCNCMILREAIDNCVYLLNCVMVTRLVYSFC